LEICEDFDCPTAEVFRAAVKRWGRPLVEVEQAVFDAGERASEGLRRFLRVFSAVSNVAPLLGLLGTVSGMIGAFQTMSSGAGAANPEQLGSGISEALITTAAGLCVAIPAYLAYVFFSARADALQTDIDRMTIRVVESISAEGLENRSKSRGKPKKAA
jgi:biopolymer transport protein ExbB